MVKTTKIRKLRQVELEVLDQALGSLRAPSVPRSGWAKSVREALGMTREQLGQRLGVSAATVADLERSEAAGTITLKSLRRLAAGLGLQAVHLLLPPAGKTLEGLVYDQARAVARKRVDRVRHTMALEDQGVEPSTGDRQVERTVQKLLSGSRRDLWR